MTQVRRNFPTWLTEKFLKLAGFRKNLFFYAHWKGSLGETSFPYGVELKDAKIFIQTLSEGGLEMTTLEENTTSYSRYYEENLYKLQNGILNIVKESKAPFYLTGGTALSRCHYNHRYSDDLDFFLNADNDFSSLAENVILNFKKAGYSWDEDTEFYKSIGFYTMKVHSPDFEMGLKIDFVNDVKAHFGDIQEHEIFPRVDSVRNILSNKISAATRFAAKDMADIREICLHEKFNWDEIFNEVQQKTLGLNPDTVSQIISGTPRSAFDKIRWTKKPSWEQFQEDLKKIAVDMLNLDKNTLCQ